MSRHTPSGIPIPQDWPAHAAQWMTQLDREATAAGRAFKLGSPDRAELLRRADEYADRGLDFLASINRQDARILALGDERLIGASVLYRAADGGTRRFFITQYREQLGAHLALRPSLEATE